MTDQPTKHRTDDCCLPFCTSVNVSF